MLTFYIVLFAAGSQDIFAQHLNASIPDVNRAFRVLLVVAPLVVAAITWKWCHDLLRRPDDDDDPDEDRTPITAPTLQPADAEYATEHDNAPSLLVRLGVLLAMGAEFVHELRRRRR